MSSRGQSGERFSEEDAQELVADSRLPVAGRRFSAALQPLICVILGAVSEGGG